MVMMSATFHSSRGSTLVMDPMARSTAPSFIASCIFDVEITVGVPPHALVICAVI